MNGPSRLAARCVTPLLLLSDLWPRAAAIAQSPAAASDQRRWSVSVYLGASAGGPARDVEAAMTANGYTDPFGGCTPFFGCVPESPSPASYSHHNPWLLSVRYLPRGVYGAELLLGQASSGTTSGRREDQMLDVEYGGTIVAPLATVGTSRLRLGAGPALLRSRWDYREPGAGSRDGATTRTFGWVGNAALAVPFGSWFEAGVTGQYRGFGTTTVEPPPSGASLGTMAVRAAHWYAAGGVGARF